MESTRAVVDTSEIPSELLEAEREVELRKRALTQSLHDAGATGQRMAQRLGEQAKPVLIGAGVLVGAAAITGIVVAVSRSRRRPLWAAPQRSSMLGGVARAAGMWLLRLAVRRVAEEVTQRLAYADPALGGAHAGSIAATPNQI